MAKEHKANYEDYPNVTIRLSDLGIFDRIPDEVELDIQKERVIGIIDKTIQQVMMATCLPAFLRNNCCILRHHFDAQEIEFIRNVCVKFVLPDQFSMTSQRTEEFETYSTIIEKINLAATNSKKKETFDQFAAKKLGPTANPLMAQVVEMLWANKALKDKVLANFSQLTSKCAMTFVENLKSLKEIVKNKFKVGATQLRAHEKRLQIAWKEDEQITEALEVLKQRLEEQRINLGQQLEDKKAKLEEYTRKVEAISQHLKNEIILEVQESEKEMIEDTIASTERQDDLAAEAKVITQQYEALLLQHISFEKGLRAKRLKIEAQVSSWLVKYDADIGERQAQYEELTKGYEAEKADMKALQEKFDEQEVDYNILMAEKEEEEQRMWEERAYEYLLNRSARKIQRCWRAYHQRKLDRKKARKGRAKSKK